jgi:hypothetical protein
MIPSLKNSLLPPSARPNPALCAGVVSRLLWAAGALLLLWVTIHWALS